MDELKDLDKKKSLERFKQIYSRRPTIQENKIDLEIANPLNVGKFDPTLDSPPPIYSEFGKIEQGITGSPSIKNKISDKVFLNAVKNLSFDEQKTIIDLFLGKKK